MDERLADFIRRMPKVDLHLHLEGTVRPATLAHLAAHRIACDVCPTSNVCLGISPSVADHPIRQLVAAGVPVTLGSDDPALFQTTLTDEFLEVARAQGFTAAELAGLVRTAVEVSFLPEEGKTALAARVDKELAQAMADSGIQEAQR